MNGHDMSAYTGPVTAFIGLPLYKDVRSVRRLTNASGNTGLTSLLHKLGKQNIEDGADDVFWFLHNLIVKILVYTISCHDQAIIH